MTDELTVDLEAADKVGPNAREEIERVYAKHMSQRLHGNRVKVTDGVGPEAPTVENDKGGKQSLKRWRFDLVDAGAMFVLGRILDAGARKYGGWNWLKIDVEDHLNSVIMHVYAYLNGDRSDDHLGHAFTRCMFALGVALREGYDARQADEK